MGKLRSIVIVLCALSLNSIAMERVIEIQGHRGCRGLLPENTLSAFQAALDASIDVLEMDVAVTKDRVLVISHDPHISAEICLHGDGRAIENPPLINELTLLEVKSFDCGSLKHQRFPQQITSPGEKIPTLAEVFALVRNSPLIHAQKIGFNIETKIFRENPEFTVLPDEFAELIVNEIRQSGFLSRVTLQSFDPRTLIEAKEREPTLRRVMLIEDGSLDMAALGRAVDAYAISPNFELLTRELVASLQDQGFKVIPWTINTEDGWSHCVNLGVDGIITDYPQALKRFLAQ